MQDWADGSLDSVVTLLVRLISHFKVREKVLEQLAGVELANAKVDACIVERIKAAIAIVAGCHTKQQWLELSILFRGVAPVPAASGSHAGLEAPIARRLGSTNALPTGSRKRRGKMQDYAFTKAIKDRVKIDAAAKEAARPREELAPGDAVLCRGELAKLEWYDAASGRCGVTFSYEGVEETVTYASRFRVKGADNKMSARLQRPQPSLMPPPRAQSKQAVDSTVRDHVREIFELTCPTSPHQKDRRKRHLGRHVWQVSTALGLEWVSGSVVDLGTYRSSVYLLSYSL